MSTEGKNTQAELKDIPLDPAPSQSPTNSETTKGRAWRRFFRTPKRQNSSSSSDDEVEEKIEQEKPAKWSLGILNDKQTDEVPGSVLLLSKSTRNVPLGIQNQPARRSSSSIPYRPASLHSAVPEKKKTADGKIILEPQPDDSPNDPLNWATWRRDSALLSLGFYCMLGGGMTPVLAAGFNNVAEAYHTSEAKVAYTTGLYMTGLGIGSVLWSPTAIIFGKRPVYLIGAIIFIITSVWCAVSPNYASLVVARIFMGVAVSPVECLPSATIAEIFFLHERAYRLGIYTLLLLSGKNIIPLVSAAIIQALGWRWVFWICAMAAGLGLCVLFLFVPETFWDRTPRPHKRPTAHRTLSNIMQHALHPHHTHGRPAVDETNDQLPKLVPQTSGASEPKQTLVERRLSLHKQKHTHFSDDGKNKDNNEQDDSIKPMSLSNLPPPSASPSAPHDQPHESAPGNPGMDLHSFNPHYYAAAENAATDYVNHEPEKDSVGAPHTYQLAHDPDSSSSHPATNLSPIELEEGHQHILPPMLSPALSTIPGNRHYTAALRTRPPKTFVQTLKPWNGFLHRENWFKVAMRPFILFAYPAVLWSTLVYSLSIGWLIVLSEAMSTIFKNKDTYNFSSLGTGLLYISPFVGGILGTAVAGKISDVIVRYMSRRNDGVYEPEFRLIMAIPVVITTAIGLMGFGWSVEERDKWIVPTVFFGIISFGCSLGSTTSITFCVDSYRQYAGEALVTLNFSKKSDGAKTTFLAIGGIQIACLLTTIPMYIFGKRARMWTVRQNLMEKF
ncbi:MAG: hypothetical protein M1834_000440 [Cirrosporium novae-zelandiae]|nr:MAG: hypothetical protein M1834_000440 [Cirrosporium novae-zelandiae]